MPMTPAFYMTARTAARKSNSLGRTEDGNLPRNGEDSRRSATVFASAPWTKVPIGFRGELNLYGGNGQGRFRCSHSFPGAGPTLMSPL